MRAKDGATLRRWRERRNLSQRELGFLARCSQNMIWKLENEKARTLSEALALEIARRLDVPWEDLFEPRESSGVRRMTTAARPIRQQRGAA
ncbi:helix-turn-helix transcriptional regulator [Actinopolymorpha alba]|uniref:helix-turn-helix transcriptional regulator n=1 Tax=Actinopolymorpha alba TaxID=533267 RepID=UPI0003A56A97|nr:helix-turn-helix transcriptional regulator [Actinopolymorpha alba]